MGFYVCSDWGVTATKSGDGARQEGHWEYKSGEVLLEVGELDGLQDLARLLLEDQVDQVVAGEVDDLEHALLVGVLLLQMASWWYLELRCESTLRRISALATAKSAMGWLSSRLKIGLPLEP